MVQFSLSSDEKTKAVGGGEFVVVVFQGLSCVRLFATPWAKACQASLSSLSPTQSLLKLMSIELVMLSNHLILGHLLLPLHLIFPSIRILFKFIL